LMVSDDAERSSTPLFDEEEELDMICKANQTPSIKPEKSRRTLSPSFGACGFLTICPYETNLKNGRGRRGTPARTPGGPGP